MFFIALCKTLMCQIWDIILNINIILHKKVLLTYGCNMIMSSCYFYLYLFINLLCSDDSSLYIVKPVLRGHLWDKENVA